MSIMGSLLHTASVVMRTTFIMCRFSPTTIAAPLAAPWYPINPDPDVSFSSNLPLPVAPMCPHPSVVPAPQPSWSSPDKYPKWGPNSVTCESACLKYGSKMATVPVTCVESCTKCHTEFWTWLCERQSLVCEVTDWPEAPPPHKRYEGSDLVPKRSLTTSVGRSIAAHIKWLPFSNGKSVFVNSSLPAPTPVNQQAADADTCVNACANSNAGEGCFENCQKDLTYFEHAQCVEYTSSCQEDEFSLQCAEDCPVTVGPFGYENNAQSDDALEKRNAQLLAVPPPFDQKKSDLVNRTLPNLVSMGVVTATDIQICVDACGTGCASTIFCDNSVLCAQYCLTSAKSFSLKWSFCRRDPVYWSNACNDIIKNRRKTIFPIDFGTDTKCKKTAYPPQGGDKRWTTVDCKKEVMPPDYSPCPECRSRIAPANSTISNNSVADAVAYESFSGDIISGDPAVEGTAGEEIEER